MHSESSGFGLPDSLQQLHLALRSMQAAYALDQQPYTAVSKMKKNRHMHCTNVLTSEHNLKLLLLLACAVCIATGTARIQACW